MLSIKIIILLSLGYVRTFDQETINELKETFTIMDQNEDGVIDKSDLKDLYDSMGQFASDAQLEDMIKEAPGPINFTVFLTLVGERLAGTEPEENIDGAFRMFDEGSFSEDELQQILAEMRGHTLTDDEINAMYKGNPLVSKGKVDYKALVKLITTGAYDP